MNASFGAAHTVDDPAAPSAGSARPRDLAAWTGLLVGAGVLWTSATVTLTHGLGYWTSEPRIFTHLLANAACLGASVWRATRLRGSLDVKVSQALLGTFMVFGAFALLILSARLFFSRPFLVSTATEAAALSAAVVVVRHKLAPARVALIGPLAPGAAVNGPVTLVVDPEADLRPFDILLVSLSGPVSSGWSRALARAMLCGCRVRHVGEYVEELRGAVSLEHFEHEHLTVQSVASYRPIKRLIDIILVLVTLWLTLPVLLLGMLLVAVGSGLPVFFVQERIGLGGRRFRMWKLRTMTVEASSREARAALPGDRRVTGVGRFLRRFRIDELPQLWNVLKGDMSLIGPRPEAVPLHEAYLGQLPNYIYRYLVRPGITGWAQVNTSPSANAEEARQKLTFDLFYVKKLSLYLDAQILLRTFWTITSGSGVR